MKGSTRIRSFLMSWFILLPLLLPRNARGEWLTFPPVIDSASGSVTLFSTDSPGIAMVNRQCDETETEDPGGISRNIRDAEKKRDTDSFHNQSGSRIITREMIRTAGITRLADLHLLLDGWNRVSVNGYGSRVAPAAVPMQNSTWKVVIDHLPATPSFLDPGSLHQLPLSLQEIEKVIILDTPQFYEGHYAGSGLIHFITDREQQGLRADARFAAGNEINDPGPYEFTPLVTPNQERTGPDGDLLLGYRSGRWFISGSGSMQRNRSSDMRIEQRIKEMLYTGSRFESHTVGDHSLRFRGGYHGSRAGIALQGALLRGRDLPFFPSWGREIPVENRNRSLGADLFLAPRPSVMIRLRTAMERLETPYAPNRLEHHFDFDRIASSHQLGMEWATGPAELSAWIGWQRSEVLSAGSGPATGYTTFLLQGRHKAGSRADLSAGVRMATGEDRLGATLVTRLDWKAGRHHSLHPWLSWHEALPAENADIWFWNRRGYDHWMNPEIVYGTLPSERGARIRSAGLAWTAGRAEGMRIGVTGTIERRDRVLLSGTEWDMVHPWQWFQAEEFRFYPDERATLTRFDASFRFRSHERMEHDIHLSTHQVITSSEELGRALRELPARTVRLSSCWTPVEGVQLQGHLRIRSSSIWREFELVDGAQWRDQRDLVSGTYSNRTGAATLLDVGGTKSLAGRRLFLSLMIRNLLNQPEITHPVGAVGSLQLYLQLEMAI